MPRGRPKKIVSIDSAVPSSIESEKIDPVKTGSQSPVGYADEYRRGWLRDTAVKVLTEAIARNKARFETDMPQQAIDVAYEIWNKIS